MLFTLVINDVDGDSLAFVFADTNDTACTCETCRTTRGASFEKFNDARKTAGDVLGLGRFVGLLLVGSVTQPAMAATYPSWNDVVKARKNTAAKAAASAMAVTPSSTRIGLAVYLCRATAGWTPELRKEFFGFLDELSLAEGGNSLKGFVRNIRKETLAAMPAAERAGFLEAQVQAAQRLRDYPRLVRAAQAYLAAGGTNLAVRLAMLQAMSLQGQHAQAAQAVEALIAGGGAVPAPSERELRLMAASYKQLKNEAGYYRALKQLVARFPTNDYWIDLVSRIRNLPDFNPRLELDVYRLLEEAGGLDEGDDIAYMATLALKAGLPLRPRLVIFGGGLPIVENGVRIGGIGVSGGSAEQDEECAKAGLAAIGLA